MESIVIQLVSIKDAVGRLKTSTGTRNQSVSASEGSKVGEEDIPGLRRRGLRVRVEAEYNFAGPFNSSYHQSVFS